MQALSTAAVAVAIVATPGARIETRQYTPNTPLRASQPITFFLRGGAAARESADSERVRLTAPTVLAASPADTALTAA